MKSNISEVFENFFIYPDNLDTKTIGYIFNFLEVKVFLEEEFKDNYEFW